MVHTATARPNLLQLSNLCACAFDLSFLCAGTGTTFDYQKHRMMARCSDTVGSWIWEHTVYYSGVRYAEERLCDGSRTGMIVAMSIGGANLLVLLCCCCGFFRCLRTRACYTCLKATAPSCLKTLERCGCGPSGETKEQWEGLSARAEDVLGEMDGAADEEAMEPPAVEMTATAAIALAEEMTQRSKKVVATVSQVSRRGGRDA